MLSFPWCGIFDFQTALQKSSTQTSIVKQQNPSSFSMKQCITKNRDDQSNICLLFCATMVWSTVNLRRLVPLPYATTSVPNQLKLQLVQYNPHFLSFTINFHHFSCFPKHGVPIKGIYHTSSLATWKSHVGPDWWSREIILIDLNITQLNGSIHTI